MAQLKLPPKAPPKVVPKPAVAIPGGAPSAVRAPPAPSGGPAAPLVKEPELFRRFLVELLPILQFPDTTYEVLKSFGNMDVKAEKLASALNRNPYYRAQFQRYFES